MFEDNGAMIFFKTIRLPRPTVYNTIANTVLIQGDHKDPPFNF